MKKFLSILFCLSFFLCPLVFAQEFSKEILYVGTFSERGSKGIYVLELDPGTSEFTHLQSISDKQSPSFLTLHPNGQYLYAVNREGLTKEDPNGSVTAYAIDQTTAKLSKINEQSSEGAGPCHISLTPDGKYAYVSNYSGGNLAVYPVGKDGSLGRATDIVQHKGSSINQRRQEKPHVHSAIPSGDGKFVYASDLGIDKIMIYQLDPASGKLAPAKTPFVKATPGAGPRHFAIHPRSPYAYSLEELSSTVTTYRIKESTGELKAVDRQTTLSNNPPFEGEKKAADIHVSSDGRFLYASNRGEDKLSIYAIGKNAGKPKLVGHVSSGGATPRNFLIDDKGAFVLIANQDSDNVVVFDRNQDSGTLSPIGKEVNIPAAVSIQQLRLP